MGENSAAAFFSLFFGVIIGAEPQVKHSRSQRERFHYAWIIADYSILRFATG
jgi:hypothetical protein